MMRVLSGKHSLQKGTLPSGVLSATCTKCGWRLEMLPAMQSLFERKCYYHVTKLIGAPDA